MEEVAGASNHSMIQSLNHSILLTLSAPSAVKSSDLRAKRGSRDSLSHVDENVTYMYTISQQIDGGIRMPSTTVRIKRETKRTLDQIANQTGQKTQDVLDHAIDAYRRRIFLDQANRAYATLRQDGARWAEEIAERKAWNATSGDDLRDA